MPVSILVREVARIYPDRLLAVFANVSEIFLITLYTEGFFVFEHISLACQIGVAMPAQEVVNVEALVHGLQIFVREDELCPFFAPNAPHESSAGCLLIVGCCSARFVCWVSWIRICLFVCMVEKS